MHMMHDMQMRKDSFLFCQKTCQSGCEHHGETQFYLKILSKTRSLVEMVSLGVHIRDVQKMTCLNPPINAWKKVYACMHECMIMFKFGENMVG
jgi:hypothetical protein